MDDGEVIIGDGGFVFSLEKRGYVKAGPWTPEAAIEYPEAVLGLHREFGRAGADVFQTFTFYASEDKLENRGNLAAKTHTCAGVNRAACNLARKAADEFGGLVAGGLSQTPSYLSAVGKEKTQAVFRQQLEVFREQQVDFMIVEYFEHVEECVWAIEACREFNFDVMATLCCDAAGDLHGVGLGECALQMVRAGACCIGVNCHFGPDRVVEAVRQMRAAVVDAGLQCHFACQPLGYWTPDASRQGFIDLPEFPFALEPRVCTRFEMGRYAREAYEAGVRYIGGCCGVESYHIRALAMELQQERGGRLPVGCDKYLPRAEGLRMHTKPWVRVRACQQYWDRLQPASGRPYCASMSKPDQWSVTQGSELLRQQNEETSEEQLSELLQQKARLCADAAK